MKGNKDVMYSLNGIFTLINVIILLLFVKVVYTVARGNSVLGLDAVLLKIVNGYTILSCTILIIPFNEVFFVKQTE